ncbi:hypothetical protein MPSEU_000999400 [Mayamaea pseudoterrestris]|nr:hypothetical protein MPSEU_000999400 [Mayamaea pseudoterrestris]
MPTITSLHCSSETMECSSVSKSPMKKARFSNASIATKKKRKAFVSSTDFCTIQPHLYGVLPSGNRLFDQAAAESKDFSSPNQLLSDECWYNALEYCDGASLARVGQSCKYFYVVSHEPSLWRDLVLRINQVITKAGPTWKDCYVGMQNQKHFVLHKPLRVRGIYSDYLHRLHACRSFSIPQQWLEQNDSENLNNALIDRVHYKSMTIERFEREYEAKNRPVVIQGGCKSWRAFKRWTDQDYLLQKTNGRTFRATSGTAPLSANFTFQAYQEYCRSESLEEGPVYLFDRTALQPRSVLWKDYMLDLQRDCPYWDPERTDTTHDLFKVLGEGRRPDHTWLICGPRRSGSVFHIDPNATHAWNATIVGRKRWIFYPPGVTPPGVMPSDDGDEVTLPLSLGEWLLQFYDEHVKRLTNAPLDKRPIEFTAFPGDVVFVPHGYWHLVINLDETNIAVTHNYCSGSNLSSVLKFIRERNDQVSGCRDRPESIKPEHLYDEFVDELKKKYPKLIDEALQNDAWACDAWRDKVVEVGENENNGLNIVGAEQLGSKSIMTNAKEDAAFTFGFSL